NPSVALFCGMELFGCYREGRLLVAAPHDHEAGAVAFDAGRVVIATGRRSIPPLVPGSHVPGVMDAHAAFELAAGCGVMPGRAIAVVGTGAEGLIAERLRAFGAEVVHVGPVTALRRIVGRARVRAIDVGRMVRCDAVVHAGPWRADPGLVFQIAAEGLFQLAPDDLPGHVAVVGAAAAGDESIPVPAPLSSDVLVCPCMDVTAGELLSHIDAGETDPEVLKRLTSCGMGPCQGFPCWESMLAILAARTGRPVEALRRPSHRPPRRAITVAQAAGLCGIVEPDR
ncbi:MAG: (2Fe-2S)-binding protein, partial [Rhodospirillaceae bacterium]|nr:(2Fe-2S)-binding protein [Rhodospirillaceae bacterium]